MANLALNSANRVAIVEAGGIGQAFDTDTVTDGAERLRNVLRHLKMLAGSVTDYGPLTYFSNFAWVNAVRGGLDAGVEVRVPNLVWRDDRKAERLELGQILDQVKLFQFPVERGAGLC